MKKYWRIIIFLAVGATLFVLLQSIFSGRYILPQGFELGFLRIRYYGMFLGVAVMAGLLLARNRINTQSINPNLVENLFALVIVFGFFGARLYHVFSSLSFYASRPWQIFALWQGGLSIYGAVLGGATGLYVYANRNKLSFLRLLDWLAPSVALGQAIGRFGNLFNYELFGYPTALPWKMFVPAQFRPEEYAQTGFFHPLFLYESIISGLILLLLLKLSKTSRPGMLFLAYVLMYNIARFFLEFLRIESVFAGSFRVNAIVSFVLALSAFAGILFLKPSHGQKP